MPKLIPEKVVASLKNRRRNLERQIKNRTIWEMVDPPLKSKEEIAQLKEGMKLEIDFITKILKENTSEKYKATYAKKKALKKQLSAHTPKTSLRF